MKRFFTYLYPFFFALYPILELRNHNITYVGATDLIRPILFSVLLTGLIWIVLRLLLRDWQKAGILTTLLMVAFFTYGQVFIEIESAFGIVIRHRYLVLIYAGVLFVLGM